MTLSRESKQIEGILADLESDSAARKTAAFDSIVLFFNNSSAWQFVNKKTRYRLANRVLEFLDSPPVGDSPATVMVKSVPLELVGLAAARIPDPRLRARIDKLRRSENANVRECVTRAWEKAWPEPEGIDALGDLFDKTTGIPSSTTKDEESGMVGLGAEFGSGKTFWKDKIPDGNRGLAPSGPERPARRIPKLSRAEPKAMDMGHDGSGRQPGFTRARPPAAPAGTNSSSFKPTQKSQSGEFSGATRDDIAMGMDAGPAGREARGAAMAITAAEPERYLNLGFVTEKEPDKPIFQTVPLQAGAKYYFLFSIGKKADWSGVKEEEARFSPVPGTTPLRVDLDVTKGGLTLRDKADTGELRVEGDHAVVTRQPGQAINDVPVSKNGNVWLFFPVMAPAADEDCEMICTVFYKQAILQRHRISVKVRVNPGAFPPGKNAWTVERVFAIADKFVPDLLAQMQEHRASLFFDLTTQGDSHIYIYGTDGEGNPRKNRIVFQALELQNMIDNARDLLAGISFYEDKEGKIQSYYPPGQKDKELLKTDLLSLAEWGSNIYAKMLADIRETDDTAFARTLEAPSYIQIAMQENPQNFFPAALIYDFPLNTREKPETYTLCRQFCSYLDNGTDLETITCYDASCRAKTDPRKQTICPMGFWGFRHNLNMPLSVGGDTVPGEIPTNSGLKVVMVTADELDPENTHRSAVSGLVKNSRTRFPGAVLESARTEQELLSRMKESPQILYFFCHGGDLYGDTPLLKAGPVNSMFVIDPKTLREVTWKSPRPLVFINGCHTGDAEPKKYLDFIEPLIVSQRAAGVIGTEITIFAPMASLFAEKTLAAFLAGGTIAEAIRGARLKVLSNYNPLGLVYNPFISGGIRLG